MARIEEPWATPSVYVMSGKTRSGGNRHGVIEKDSEGGVALRVGGPFIEIRSAGVAGKGRLEFGDAFDLAGKFILDGRDSIGDK